MGGVPDLLAAVQAREADVSDLNVALDATLEEGPPHFSAIKLTVTGKYPDMETMEKLVTIAERGCIVANTIKGSVALTFNIS